MGTCKYCGQDAGWFSKQHKECEEKHNLGVQELKAVISRYFTGRATCSDIMYTIQSKRRDNYLSDDDICVISDAEIRSYTASIHRPFSPSSMKLMDEYLTVVGVSYSDINKNGAVDENGVVKDADLATRATIYAGSLISAIEEAVNNA